MELNEQHTASDKNFCDNINLKTFTKLQPYGVLLVIDKATLTIIQYSANVSDVLETPIKRIMNNPINPFLAYPNRKNHLTSWLLSANKRYGRFLWNGEKNQIDIWVYIHQQNDIIILEIERAQDIDLEDKAFSVFDEIINFKHTPSKNNLESTATSTCNQIRSITDYDRVIIYQFKSDHTGVVIGESLQDGMDSYMGLHFPATDVPAAVREMYIHQPLRYIPSVDNNTIELLQNPEVTINSPIDLTNVVLRAVAPVHIEYLTNMGVASSLSVAIIHNNALWGLIACHHKTPRKLSLYYRFGLLLLSKVLGQRLVLMESNQYNKMKSETAHLLSVIETTIQQQTDIFSGFMQTKDKIITMLSGDGIAIFYNNQCVTHGNTPTHQQIIYLVEWLLEKQYNTLFVTHELSAIYPESTEYKQIAAGLLAIPITPDEKNYLLIFREEILSTVSWAGDPHSTLTIRGNEYSPRHSFQSWKQTIENKSKPWKHYELTLAKQLQACITAKQLQLVLQEQAQKDPLTGLYNRRLLLEKLNSEIARAKRNKSTLAIFMLDLDFFKKINDTFSHAAGDLVLVKTGELLRNIARPYDSAYRYGGEEFILVLSNVTSNDVMKKAEDILEKVRSLKIQFDNSMLPHITISIGISLCPEHGDEPNQLIEKADQALYQAKSTGRDKALLYTP